MKVICIDAKDRDDDYTCRENVVEGVIYTVKQVVKGYGMTGDTPFDCYELEEIKPDYTGPILFDTDRFIPLSGIDEMELVNQKEQLA